MFRCFTLAAAAALAMSQTALAQEHGEHEKPPPVEQQQQTHDEHMLETPAQEHGAHEGHEAAREERMEHMGHGMTGVLGAYPMTRDASGTSWQADASEHAMVEARRGDWILMGHVLLNGVYDWQGGPRGDEMGFVSGMVMGAARRDFASGDVLNLRAMLSPDPTMGKEGYPLLLAAGETADGVTPLVDRQHPHDLFMELSASYSHRLGASDSLYIYAGLPGEPAFGPPAFMHRLSAMDSPEAPITHHWLDSTHITFGVLTAGFVHENWKLEASGFRGREPDEHRYDIETPRLDSASVRASWNPNPNWSLQASWADIQSPEQLEPEEDEERVSLSAIHTRPLGEGGWWSTTFAFANKDRSDGASLDVWLLESALKPARAWTLFVRAEWVETDELGASPHGPIEDVARASIGLIHDWRVGGNTAIGLGALASRAFVSDAPAPLYDGDQDGAMAFVRLKVD